MENSLKFLKSHYNAPHYCQFLKKQQKLGIINICFIVFFHQIHRYIKVIFIVDTYFYQPVELPSIFPILNNNNIN